MILSDATQRVKPSPPHEVTTRSDAEVDPAAGGLTREDIDAIWSRAEAVYRSGLHPALALCMRRRGQVMLDRAIGHARGNAPDDPPDAPRVLATPSTLFNIFSASKAVTAMLVHALDQEGLLHVDDPVEEYLPEFGRNGKRWVTLRHVLTHRAGIPSLPARDADLDLLADRQAIVQLLCDARPVNRPGRRLAYHALTGGYILGEVIERVTGADLRTVLRERITGPLGLRDMDYGVAPAQRDRVARNARTGPPVRWPASWLLERALGVPFDQATELINDPRFLSAVVPAGNVHATADELCRFFEMLLRGGALGEARVLDPRVVRRARGEQSFLEVDLTFGLPIRYGMGLILGGRRVSLYGPDTPQAFGHLGFTCVLGYADPRRDISVAIMTSGKPFLTPRLRPLYQLVSEIAQRTR